MIPLILIGVIVSGVLILWWLLKDDSVLEKTEDKANLVHGTIKQNNSFDYERLKEDYKENYLWACNKFGVKCNVFNDYKYEFDFVLWYCYQVYYRQDKYYPFKIPKPKSEVEYPQVIRGFVTTYIETGAIEWMREVIEIIQNIRLNTSEDELDLILKYRKHNLDRKEFSFVFDKCEKYKYNQEQLFGKEFGNI